MSQDSTKVIVPGHGRFWTCPTDTNPPGQIVKITGAPTQAVVTFTVNAVAAGTGVTLKANDTIAQKCASIASALAALSTVGAGNVVVLPTTDPWTFTVILMPEVVSPTITATSTFTGGTTPAIAVSTTARSVDFASHTEVGHTSADNPLQMNRSGGDVTTLGSWQQSDIDSSTADVSWSMAFSLLQYDVASLKLYHGSNAVIGADGQVGTALSGPTPTECGLFLVIRNGGKAQARSYPRVSIIAADGESFDTAKLAEMPVQATLLSSNTLTYGQGVSLVGAAA